MGFFKAIAAFLGWLTGALAGIGAILYACGFLVTRAHLRRHRLRPDRGVDTWEPSRKETLQLPGGRSTTRSQNRCRGNPIAPSLAKSWTVSPDSLSHEFVLRRGVKFHNGDHLTAENVKFSMERYRGAASGPVKTRIAGVEG